MAKEDYVHFLKDRLKIAKNLKYMMKRISRQKPVVTDASNLKLYEIQVYRNVIYVYVLLMPIIKFFCFVKVANFIIPTNQAMSPIKTQDRLIYSTLFSFLTLTMAFISVYDTEESFQDMLRNEVYREYPSDIVKKITERKITVNSRYRNFHFKMMFSKNSKGLWPKHVHNWGNVVPQDHQQQYSQQQYSQQQQRMSLVSSRTFSKHFIM